jgi:hypothetical protein
VLDLTGDVSSPTIPNSRFTSSFHANAALVESHRKASIFKTQKTSNKLPNAGTALLSSQNKPKLLPPIKENVDVVLMEGTAGAPKSFKTIGIFDPVALTSE